MKKREINTDTNIAQNFGTVKLEEDFDTIEEHFGTKPTAKHIHIIVYPPSLATTGKCLLMVCQSNKDIFFVGLSLRSTTTGGFQVF